MKKKIYMCLIVYITFQTLFVMSTIETEGVKKTEVKHVKKTLTNDIKIGKLEQTVNFTATAYTLWETPSRYYNARIVTTKDGTNLKHKSRVQAMTIAVDKRIIPMGSIVYIEFKAPYKTFSGRYEAHDTGKKIIGYHVDIFLGCRTKVQYKTALNFGKRIVKIKILRRGY